MKKVLHVLASNKFSGAENVVCTIIKNFENDYKMAYCSPFGAIEGVLKNKKIKYYGIEKLNINHLKKVIKKFNPDIIHAHDYTASVITALSGFKGKIISHLHINASFAQKWNLKTIVYSLVSSKFNSVIGVSNSVLEEAIFKNKIKNKYVTIYNYIDKENIVVKSKEYESKSNYDLFYIGRLNDLKNPLEFIDIVNEVKKENKNIKAVIIGDGELKKMCELKIKELNLEKNITLTGFLENPFPIIKKSKIGIMPSKVEGFGLTAVESMILGKPVLNSGVGGLKEIFQKNKVMICKNKKEYINKIKNIKELKLDENIVDKYINKLEWQNKLNELYK